MIRALTPLALIALLLVSLPLHAQEGAIDVEAATARILAQDAGLEVARARLREAEAGMPIASASPWDRPELRVSGLSSQDLAGQPFEQVEVALRSPLPRPGDARRARTQGAAEVSDAGAEAQSLRWQVEVEVRRLFQILALLREAEDAHLALAQARRASADAWEVGLQEGSTTELDRLRAELKAAEAEDALAEAQARREAVEANIRRWARLAPTQPLTPGAAPLPDTLGWERALDLALQARPELRAAEAGISAAQAALAQARVDNLPWIDFLQVGYDAGPAPLPEGSPLPGALTLGAAFTLPRLTPSRAGIPLAQARLEGAQAEARLARQEIEGEVHSALQAWTSARTRAARLAAGPLKTAAATSVVAEEALAEGRLSLPEIMAFKADALELELRRIDLRLSEIDGEAALLTAIGAPLKGQTSAGDRQDDGGR